MFLRKGSAKKSNREGQKSLPLLPDDDIAEDNGQNSTLTDDVEDTDKRGDTPEMAENSQNKSDHNKEAGNTDKAPMTPFSKRGSHSNRPPAAPNYNPEVAAARPLTNTSAQRPMGGSNRPSGGHDSKCLIVGKEIKLSGEITACDKLVVEGRVEANLTDANDIEVCDEGLFNGSAVVDHADIAGRFEGELTAHKSLVVRASGQIIGTVRYSSIVIEDGGEVSGTISKLEESMSVKDEEDS